MAYDITSWGVKSSPRDSIPKIIENFRAIKEDGVATPSSHEHPQYNLYTDGAIANLLNGSPEALDTLWELANALGNDPEFAATVMTQIGTKLGTSEVVTTPTSNKVLRLDASAKLPWNVLSGTPTTLAGYGITDAAPKVSPVFNGGVQVDGGAEKIRFTRTDYDIYALMLSTPVSGKGLGIYNVTDSRYDLFVSDTGNLLVGATDDDTVNRLQVNGSVALRGAIRNYGTELFQINNFTGKDMEFVQRLGGNINFYTGNADKTPLSLKADGSSVFSGKASINGGYASDWLLTCTNTLTNGNAMYFGYVNTSTGQTGGLVIQGGRGGAIDDDFAVTNKFHVKGDGKVGIGTATPSTQSKLHLCDATYGGITLERSHATYPSKWTINPGHASANDLSFINQSSNDFPLMLSGNKVGIGSVYYPKATLHSSGSTILGGYASVAIADVPAGCINLALDEVNSKVLLNVRFNNGNTRTITL